MTESKANIQQWSEAPAGTYNPYANDPRCEPVHYVSHKESAEVINAVVELVATDITLSDYDFFQDYTVGNWVGVTCRDIDTTNSEENDDY